MMPLPPACAIGWAPSTAHCSGWTLAPTAGRSAVVYRYRTNPSRPILLRSSPSRRRGFVLDGHPDRFVRLLALAALVTVSVARVAQHPAQIHHCLGIHV